jgi:hypothetical protein
MRSLGLMIPRQPIQMQPLHLCRLGVVGVLGLQDWIELVQEHLTSSKTITIKKVILNQ